MLQVPRVLYNKLEQSDPMVLHFASKEVVSVTTSEIDTICLFKWLERYFIT